MRDLVLEIVIWVCACAAGIVLALVVRELPWQSWIFIGPTLGYGTWRVAYSDRVLSPTLLDRVLIIVTAALALGLMALAICGCT